MCKKNSPVERNLELTTTLEGSHLLPQVGVKMKHHKTRDRDRKRDKDKQSLTARFSEDINAFSFSFLLAHWCQILQLSFSLVHMNWFFRTTTCFGDFVHCSCTAMGSKRKEGKFFCLLLLFLFFFSFCTDKQLSVFKASGPPSTTLWGQTVPIKWPLPEHIAAHGARQLSDTQEQIYGWKVVVWGDSQMAAHKQNDVTSGMFQTQQHICVADTAKFNRFARVKHHSCCNCNKTTGTGHAVYMCVCVCA